MSADSSCVQVRYELALQPRDLILEHEFAAFETLHLQFVDFEIHGEARNDVIEITVLNAQLAQALDVLEQIGIDVAFFFVAHGVTYFT
jgi:hypothetical protein